MLDKKKIYIFAFSRLHVCGYIFIHFICPFIRFARQHSITLLYCCSVCITCYSPDKNIKLQKALLQASYSLDSAIASSSFHNMICQEKVNLEQSGPKTLGVQRCKQVCPWWSLFNELFLFVQCTALTSKPLLFFIKEKFTLLQNTKISLPNRNV